MLSRLSSARKSPPEATSGRYQLTLAQIIVFSEAFLRSFSRPLFFAGLFAALAWLGVFAKLYPWAHLVALVIFFVLFFDGVGRARAVWKRPSFACAKRRVEEASGLTHRPLDVIEDKPILPEGDSQTLWEMHAQRAREQVKVLRWPTWKMDFAMYDRYRLRYVLAVLLALGLTMGWGALGGRMIAAINPALGKLPMSTATIDAWITPPAYTHLPPIMIATPAGLRYQDEVIQVPEGSVLNAHLAEKDGQSPVLDANNQSIELAANDGKDFGVSQNLEGGDKITLRRGWITLGSWHIRIVPDTAPQIAFTDQPSVTERKDVRLAYDAKDDNGVTAVTLRVTPRETLFGISGDPLEIPLASVDEKDVKRVDFKDLTAQPWAGLMVDMQLIAEDSVGHKAESSKIAFTLPERVFFHPIARLLIEERKKLLQNVFDPQSRNEAANLMAGLARQPESFGRDPVVMMSLRAGAVRLVLDHDSDAVLSVKDILWQSASRIEDGVLGMAEQNLKQAQQALANALDRNASEKEVQALIDQLHQALARYLSELSTRMATHPAQAQDLGQVLGSRVNMLTPQDLERMLDDMKGLSAAGARSSAREELSKLQQILENLQTRNPQLSEEQQAALERLKDLRALTHDQQELLDATFQKAQNDKQDSSGLANKQGALLKRLQSIMGKHADRTPLVKGATAMQQATQSLQSNKTDAAMPQQNEALKALQQAEQAAAKSLQQSLFSLSQPGGTSDPFGRDGGRSFSDQNSNVHVPDQFESRHVREILDEIQHRASDLSRPKTERDYIERLLQNF
jgi:uncharacterized protein (TIGR02302 family)